MDPIVVTSTTVPPVPTVDGRVVTSTANDAAAAGKVVNDTGVTSTTATPGMWTRPTAGKFGDGTTAQSAVVPPTYLESLAMDELPKAITNVQEDFKSRTGARPGPTREEALLALEYAIRAERKAHPYVKPVLTAAEQAAADAKAVSIASAARGHVGVVEGVVPGIHPVPGSVDVVHESTVTPVTSTGWVK